MRLAADEWPFPDRPNAAVVASRRVAFDGEWVAYVSHDEEDGVWQFHPAARTGSVADACLVALNEIVKRDPALLQLADLPEGWHAWRDSPQSPWTIAAQRK